MEIIILYGVFSFLLCLGIVWWKGRPKKEPELFSPSAWEPAIFVGPMSLNYMEFKNNVANYVKGVNHNMNFKDFDSQVAQLEGKKDETEIYNIRETRKIIFRLLKKMKREKRNAFIERQR